MAIVAFDTLEFVETLKEGEVSEKQAKAIAKAVRDSHESADLATKDGLEKLETSLRHDIGELETSLRHDISELETSLRHDISDSRRDAESKFEALSHEIDNVRHEVNDLRKDVDNKIEKLDLRIRGEMKTVRWMFGAVMTGVISIVSGLVVLILKTSTGVHL